MNKKSIAAAALSLALAPCICLFGCADKDSNNSSNGNQNVNGAETALNAQITGTKNTYTNIYGRAERNGGLFATSSSAGKSAARYALLDDILSNNENGDNGEQTSEGVPININTNALISELLTAIKSNGSYSLPNKFAVQSYVLDVFAYTQIASQIVEAEGKAALTKNYGVEYDLDDDFKANMKTDGNWYPNIPEEMSFAGFDGDTSKVILTFKARQPFDRQNEVNKFETVNSEMYYISDEDFGYAQFTYRDNDTGFNYFSMKDKAMLEINISPAGKLTYLDTYDGTNLNNLSASQRTAIETCLAGLEAVFAIRTAALERQNLKLAKEAGIEGVETETVNGVEVFVKADSTDKIKATFNYEILNKLK